MSATDPCNCEPLHLKDINELPDINEQLICEESAVLGGTAPCDLPPELETAWLKLCCMNQSLIDILIELNKKIDQMAPGGYFTVIKKYRITIPASSFQNTSPAEAENEVWFSGAVGHENFFTVPKADMDILDGFMTQNEVSSGLIWATTTAVQTVQDLGDHYRINIDTYGIIAKNISGRPQPVTVDLLAYGRKKF